MVTRPLLFRPPLFFSGFVSDFSGSSFVMSANEPTLPNRRPGDVGLYGLIGMFVPTTRDCQTAAGGCADPQFAIRNAQSSDPLERLAQQPAEVLALFERDDRLLPPRAACVAPAARPPQLALDVERVDALDLALAGAQGLNRVPDVDLGGVGGHLETELVQPLRQRALLRQQRPDDDQR